MITGFFEYLCTDNKIHIMNETIILKKFADIDLNDPFFKSLKEDYTEFETWFNKKSKDGSRAYVQYVNNNLLKFPTP